MYGCPLWQKPATASSQFPHNPLEHLWVDHIVMPSGVLLLLFRLVAFLVFYYFFNWWNSTYEQEVPCSQYWLDAEMSHAQKNYESTCPGSVNVKLRLVSEICILWLPALGLSSVPAEPALDTCSCELQVALWESRLWCGRCTGISPRATSHPGEKAVPAASMVPGPALGCSVEQSSSWSKRFGSRWGSRFGIAESFIYEVGKEKEGKIHQGSGEIYLLENPYSMDRL